MTLIKIDENKQLYICKLCNKEFRSFYELDTHMMFSHRLEVENEFAKVQNLPEVDKEEIEKYEKKSETVLDIKDIREIYCAGQYVLVINKDTVLRGRSWKELFEAYIKYLYQTYKDFVNVDKNLYNMFKELFEQFKLDTRAWRDFFLQLAEQNNIKVSEPQRYNNILYALKQLGFIEDFYKEK